MLVCWQMHLIVLENSIHDDVPTREGIVRACVVVSGYIIQDDTAHPGTTTITRSVMYHMFIYYYIYTLCTMGHPQSARTQKPHFHTCSPLLSTNPLRSVRGEGRQRADAAAHRKRRKEHERNETLLAVPCHDRIAHYILTVGLLLVLCFVLVICTKLFDQLCVLPVQTLSAQNLTIIYLQSGAK